MFLVMAFLFLPMPYETTLKAPNPGTPYIYIIICKHVKEHRELQYSILSYQNPRCKDNKFDIEIQTSLGYK